LAQAPVFTLRDTPMVATTIAIPRDIFIGEDMITGIILTDLISARYTITGMSTTNGNDIMTAIVELVINFC